MVLKKKIVVSMDSSVGRVAASREFISFPYFSGSNPINVSFLFLSFFFFIV